MTVTEERKIQAHYSALNTHRRCPQQYFYRYDLRLQQEENEVAPERDLGSWWSVIRAAESVERGRHHDSLKQDPNTNLKLPDGTKITVGTITVDAVFEALSHWWKGHKTQPDGAGGFAEDVWQERMQGNAPELLSGLLERHLDRWKDDIEHEHPIGVEVFWKKKLPMPKNDPWQVEYPEMTLIGYVDEIYWDAQRQLVVVRDHKTTKNMESATSVDDMMDSQLHLYAWGANDLVREWTGKSIRAVAYDKARSIAPKPPSLTKSGRLRLHKGEPTIGMTDLKTYLDWVATGPEFEGLKKDGSGAGVYEAEEKVVEALKNEAAKARWFQRSMMPLNRNLIQTHLRAAVDSSVDAYRTEYRAELTAEAQRNLTSMCKWCDYASLCRAQMIGGAKGTYDLKEHGLTSRDGLTLLDDGVLVAEQTKPTNEFDL